MNSVFLWVGSHQVAYYVVALTAIYAFLALALSSREAGDDSRRFEIGFLALTVVALFAGRWPVFFAPFALNPDEATWVAGALKAPVDAVPWRGFAPGTSGPFISYIIALPALFGAPITLASARIIGTLLMAVTSIALYYTVKWTYGARIARLSLVPTTILLSLTSDSDFVHYSSEHLPICLNAVALAAAVYLTRANTTFSSCIKAGVIVGGCLGTAAFSKLQAMPMAVLVFFFAAAAIVALRRRSNKEALVVGGVTMAALCIVPGAILVSLLLTGELDNAFTAYIRFNLAYLSGLTGGGRNNTESVGLSFFFNTSLIYTMFLWPCLIAIVVGAITLCFKRSFTRYAILMSLASILFLATTLFAIWQPHRAFQHYLLFSLFPLSWCAANALGLMRDAGVWKNRPLVLGATYAALFAIPLFSVRMTSQNAFVTQLVSHLTSPLGAPARALARYAKPGDLITIWGWASAYYAFTGTIPAARYTETVGMVRPNPYLEYFRKLYMSDLHKRKPAVFVDAVAPKEFEMTDRASEGHEKFPELTQFINEYYELKEDVDGVRIYVAKHGDAVR